MKTFDWPIYRAPFSGPEHQQAVCVDLWYDRHLRSWVVAYCDYQGNQLGEAEYFACHGLDTAQARVQKYCSHHLEFKRV